MQSPEQQSPLLAQERPVRAQQVVGKVLWPQSPPQHRVSLVQRAPFAVQQMPPLQIPAQHWASLVQLA